MSVSDQVRAFLSAAGKKGGSSKSLAKQFAARRNGKLALRKPAAAEQPDAAPAARRLCAASAANATRDAATRTRATRARRLCASCATRSLSEVASMSVPLSEEVHRLKGTRPTRAAAPQEFAAGRPSMPRHLSPIARDKWKELVRLLSQRGTLTKVDANALELYCETYQQWRACLDEIAKHGVMVNVTVTDSSGESFSKRVQNPAQKLAVQLFNALRQMLKEFAATPASREKAKPTKPAQPPKRKLEPGEDPDPIDI